MAYIFYKMIYGIFINSNSNIIDITDFILAFKKNHPVYGGNIQNDSSEFLRVLLEDFTNDLNESNMYNKHVLLENDINKTKLRLSKDYKENFFAREYSIISNNFYIQMMTIYSCKCKHELYAFQYYMDIPLLIPVEKNNFDLSELLVNILCLKQSILKLNVQNVILDALIIKN